MGRMMSSISQPCQDKSMTYIIPTQPRQSPLLESLVATVRPGMLHVIVGRLDIVLPDIDQHLHSRS